MGTFKHLQRKNDSTSVPASPSYPALRPPRSLASQPVPGQAQPETQTQSGDVARPGHSLDQISIFPQRSPAASSLPAQRLPSTDGDTIQRNQVSRADHGGDQIGQQIQAAKGGGHSLEGGTQRALEQALGRDLSGVRVHTDARANVLTQSLQADAFTVGTDIFFRTGSYSPLTPEGLHLLTHEATHIIQQTTGPVTGIPGPDGTLISDPHDRFEQAAETNAERMIADNTDEHDATDGLVEPSLSNLTPSHTDVTSRRTVIQRGKETRTKKTRETRKATEKPYGRPEKKSEESTESLEDFEMPDLLIGDYAEQLVRGFLENKLGVKLITLQNSQGHGLDVTFLLSKGWHHAAFDYLLSHPKEVNVKNFSKNIDKYYKKNKSDYDLRQPTVVTWEIKANTAQMSTAQKDADYLYIQAQKFADSEDKTLSALGTEVMQALDRGAEPFFLLGQVILKKGEDVILNFRSVEEESRLKHGSLEILKANKQLSYWSSAELGKQGEALAEHWLKAEGGYTEIATLEIEGTKGIDRIGVKGDRVDFFEIKTHVGKMPISSGLTKSQRDPVEFVMSRLLKMMEKTILEGSNKVLEDKLKNESISRSLESIGKVPDLFELLKIDWTGGVNEYDLVTAFLQGKKNEEVGFQIVHVVLPEWGTSGAVEVTLEPWGKTRYWKDYYELYKKEVPMEI